MQQINLIQVKGPVLQNLLFGNLFGPKPKVIDFSTAMSISNDSEAHTNLWELKPGQELKVKVLEANSDDYATTPNLSNCFANGLGIHHESTTYSDAANKKLNPNTLDLGADFKVTTLTFKIDKDTNINTACKVGLVSTITPQG